MSSTKAPATKTDPRIAPKEAMVTRHKSAQMKRQLRTKDRSMKHLTDLLKSPTRETQAPPKAAPKKKQTSPKVKHSLVKSAERVQNLPQKTFKLSKVLRKEVLLIPDEEYYPNKLKRKLSAKKVMLKPSHALTLVGEISGSVKRKCAIPLKASDQVTPRSEEGSPVRALTMEEAMRIVEEHLTDEDMMEILTCPSPVWWEDPPDEGYIEDPIFTRIPTKQNVKRTPAEPMEVDTDTIKSDTDKFILIPNLSAKSDKFLKKRSKLEDLLGSIKNKSNNEIKTENRNDISNEVVTIRSNSDTNTNEQNKVSTNDAIEAKLSESDDEIMFHNSSMNEDELLKDLENMDIPIANQEHSSDVIVIDDDDDSLDKPKSSKEITENQESKKDETDKVTPSDTGTESINKDIKTESNEIEMPKFLPTLQKCTQIRDLVSPKSFDSLSSKSSVSVQDMDSISDTNVRFLLEDEVDDQKRSHDSVENMAVTTNEVVTQSNNNACESEKEASDYNNVTVYKIIEEMSDNTQTDNCEGNVEAKMKDVTPTDDREGRVEAKTNGDTPTDNCEGNVEANINDDTPADIGEGNVEAKTNGDKPTEVTNEGKVQAKMNDDTQTDNLEGNVEEKVNDDKKNLSKDDQKSNKKDVKSIITSSIKDKNKESKGDNSPDENNLECNIASKINNNNITTPKPETSESDIQCIVATKSSESNKIISKEVFHKEMQGAVEAKLNNYYKKCKKVYQKRPKKEDKDINRNDMIQNAEEIDNFPTMFCDPCKPGFKRVSEDDNVKYCLSCSSIFDTKDCAYCMKKFKNNIYICVPCKIKFCCDNFYKTHEKQGCAYKTVSRKVVFTQLTEKNDTTNVQIINYLVSLDKDNLKKTNS